MVASAATTAIVTTLARPCRGIPGTGSERPALDRWAGCGVRRSDAGRRGSASILRAEKGAGAAVAAGAFDATRVLAGALGCAGATATGFGCDGALAGALGAAGAGAGAAPTLFGSTGDVMVGLDGAASGTAARGTSVESRPSVTSSSDFGGPGGGRSERRVAAGTSASSPSRFPTRGKCASRTVLLDKGSPTAVGWVGRASDCGTVGAGGVGRASEDIATVGGGGRTVPPSDPGTTAISPGEWWPEREPSTVATAISPVRTPSGTLVPPTTASSLA